METYRVYYDPSQGESDVGRWHATTEPPLQDGMIAALEEIDSSVHIFSRDQYSQISARWPNDGDRLVGHLINVIEASGYRPEIITPLPDVPVDRLKLVIEGMRRSRAERQQSVII